MQILKNNQRKCPECDDIISYSSVRSKNNANRKGSICISCSNAKKIKHAGYSCPCCSKPIIFKKKSSLYRAISRKSLCKSCASSNNVKKLWENEEFRKTITENSNNFSEETIEKLSKSSKSLWQDEEYIQKMALIARKRWEDSDYRDRMKFLYSSNDYKEANSTRMKKLWEDDDYRQRVTESCRKAALTDEALERSRKSAEEQWKDPKFRTKMQNVLANQPKVSSIQNILYSLLDDLGVKYFREHNDKKDDPQCSIGPYNFDCVIPFGNKTILIECNGNYWHSLPSSRKRDKSKSTYIANNFPDYELKVIWEHEFYNLDKVTELLKYWLGLDYKVVNFDFEDLEIKKIKSSQCKEFLIKYHYLSNSGRGGKSYGCYFQSELVALAVFSPLPRQNINIDALELSRFCIHPSFRKKNFGSWFLSRVVKNFTHQNIIAYADTTFNHTGALYKACNFEFDGETKPDYWYVDDSGWVMHKKTLYNRAKNLKMTESEFARVYSYKKVYAGKKLRFLKRKAK